ncbi:MAG TPA: formylglycine-generating enzyme family protein [Spirochaetia bacterium]|nr:formylglycine-generating enzyme family protein [Spirochaetales bacterium]HRY81082.1 formylglycine-generating enzyme family protein [Spirochaetia bacterium]
MRHSSFPRSLACILALTLGLSGNLAAQEEFIRLPGGGFLMGSPVTEKQRNPDEGPQHPVKVAPFTMGRYEVTQAEWTALMENNPSRFRGDRLPVEGVSWYEALVYCNKRSIAEGLDPCYTIQGSADPADWGSVPTSSNGAWNAVVCDFSADGYRLPTEAEWEYACRARTESATAFGDSLGPDRANFDGSRPYNSEILAEPLRRTTPVGSYPANPWGFHDMHGNVWEWCWDHYADKYYARSPDTDPRGAEGGRYRVLRGGAWGNFGYRLRSAARRDEDPFYRDADNGFRLVRGR